MNEDKKIVDIRDKMQIWQTSQAICVNCSYVWQAVTEQSTKPYDLECPRCYKTLGSIVSNHLHNLGFKENE